MTSQKKYQSFKDFYPYCLTEHFKPITRSLHFVGTFLVLVLFILAVLMSKWWVLISIPFAGYCFYWIGHVFFEKNKPATFKYPVYSLGSDFVMFWDILTFQLPSKLKDAERKINNLDLSR